MRVPIPKGLPPNPFKGSGRVRAWGSSPAGPDPHDPHPHRGFGRSDTVDPDRVFANYKSIWSKQFGVSLVVEFVGTMLFQVIGGAAKKEFAPWVNGFALAVWIYTAANISGGHLNPAVTMSTFLCGFYPLLHSVVYVFLQVLGAIMGAFILAGLVPGASVGMGDGAPGCFDRKGAIAPGLTDAQLFGWEVVMTFTLISCVYACGIAKPGHGSHTPLAVGLALMCCAGSGGQYTGAALNPARVLGPYTVFGCSVGVAGIYVSAQLIAAALACCIFALVSGAGPLNPWVARHAVHGLTNPEAFFIWITGSAPRRLRHTGRENILDLLVQSHIKHKHLDGLKDLKLPDNNVAPLPDTEDPPEPPDVPQPHNMRPVQSWSQWHELW